MSDRALYYPYIHIRDPEWLKATLLLFGQVRRMTPRPGPQPDDGPVLPFTEPQGGMEPMLTVTDLWSDRAYAAQVELASRLEKDAEDWNFRNRFGRLSAEILRTDNAPGFQIHQAKLNERLKEVLRDTGLAWEPGNPEPYDQWLEYVELHPRIGQAEMATLAIACAMHEGLDIVGDQRSGPLHECLTRKQPREVYDAWLKPSLNVAEPPQADGRELFEFVVSVACDTTQLDPIDLARLGKDREPIRKLMKEFSERAKAITAMDPGRERTEQFLDECSRILAAWKSDRANMSNFWKKFFGSGLLEPGAELLENFVANAAEVAPAMAMGAPAALAGLALNAPLVAAGAGIGIGLFTHSAKTIVDLRARDRESPYRYLTLIEKAGVIIRTDIRDPGSST